MTIVIVILTCILIFQEPISIPPQVDNSGLKKEIINLKKHND
jgi:hypothetical protein